MNYRFRVTLAGATIATAAALAGCQTDQAATAAAPVNLSEAAFSRAPGRATVRGQMFLRRNDGVVVYGAGSDARLVPKTQHSEQAIRASFPSGKVKMHVIFGINTGANLIFDPAFEPYIRSTKADGQGNFQFQQVPPGTYYIVGNVQWCAPSRGSCDRQGGDLYDAIVVAPGSTEVTAILSGT